MASHALTRISHTSLDLKAETTNLVETCHRLISTANLDLKECSLIAITAFSRTLNLSLLSIVPRSGATKDILTL
jgi:hypothetical protein